MGNLLAVNSTQPGLEPRSSQIATFEESSVLKKVYEKLSCRQAVCIPRLFTPACQRPNAESPTTFYLLSEIQENNPLAEKLDQSLAFF